MSVYSIGVDMGNELCEPYIVIIKTNDFRAKVVAAGYLDELLEKGNKYPVKLVTTDLSIPSVVLAKIKRLIRS